MKMIQIVANNKEIYNKIPLSKDCLMSIVSLAKWCKYKMQKLSSQVLQIILV